MVVLVIDQYRVFAFKLESHAPISVHRYRIMSGKVASQRVQPPSGHVHISSALGVVQSGQLTPQLRSVMRLDSRLLSSVKEVFQSFVREGFDHDINRIA